jgi:NAD(P)-dependent dehydrogenase (short-subunit alcohol dehydrogenase family)
MASRPFDASTAYAASKQANRMYTWELARRLAGRGVTANAMHPGRVMTELFRYQRGLYGLIGKLIFKTSGVDATRGADTAVWLASAPELAGVTGKYWFERQERPCPYDDRAQCAGCGRSARRSRDAPDSSAPRRRDPDRTWWSSLCAFFASAQAAPRARHRIGAGLDAG